jgi:ribosomal protein L11 methylase PrmA
MHVCCGSGLHSLAAFPNGASCLTSFDYDVLSVETTMKLREPVQVHQGLPGQA